MKKIMVTIMVIGLLCACVFSSCGSLFDKENNNVLDRNDTLISENAELKSSNDRLKNENANLIWVNENLSNENANLKSENEKLKDGILGETKYKLVETVYVFKVNNSSGMGLNCCSSYEIKNYATSLSCYSVASRVEKLEKYKTCNVVNAEGDIQSSFDVLIESYDVSKISSISVEYEFCESISEEDKEKFTTNGGSGTDSFYFRFDYEVRMNAEGNYDVISVCHVLERIS